MSKRIFTTVLLLYSFIALNAQKQDLTYFLPEISYDSSIPTPEEFLGYQVGEWHVSHDQLAYYMKTLAESSDRISYEVYGRSHENRPLILLTITSPENHKNLENIRTAHLAITDPSAPNPDVKNMPAVIYQGFSIHGNEPSGANAGLLVAYYLAAGQGSEIDALLDNTVILFDPSYNPDGLNRFASWVNTHKAKTLTADPNDREYSEAWPRGRTNHYWFDLNRDWLLLTHPESRGRVSNFHKWKPNVLTDHHEMGTNSTFFFQPGISTRVNPNTPDRNQQLTAEIGKFHAETLDDIGSLYYSRESFDDYYYGKGSTYPDVNGGIGILFEQGSSRGHLQESVNGEVSFAFTIRNQVKTALSTQKAAVNLREELLSYQRKFYTDAQQLASKNPVKGYVFSGGKDNARSKHFIDILRAHQITVNKLKNDKNIAGQNFQKDNSYMISLDQPQYRLIKTIFEKVTTFEDSLFYDVSAWTLPLAFDLNYAELKGGIFSKGDIGEKLTDKVQLQGSLIGGNADYAYVFEWHEYYTPKLLNKILQGGLRAKVTSEVSTLKTDSGDKVFAKGSIVVPIQNQALSAAEMNSKMMALAKECNVDIYSINSGTPSKGFDMGSPTNSSLKKAEVMMFVGDGVSSYDAGEIWHLLDTRYEMTLTKMEADRIRRSEIDRYSVIIMPDGRYSGLGKAGNDAISDWVSEGGTLICYKGAIDWASSNGLVGISKVSRAKQDTSDERKPYERVRQDNGRNVIGGAIFNTKLDLSHPLAYGIENNELASFKRGTSFYELPANPYASPAVYTDNPLLSGYITKENLKALSNTAAVFVGGKGRGKVVCFADNTNFRGYWYGTNRLLANAIFFGHTISGSTLAR